MSDNIVQLDPLGGGHIVEHTDDSRNNTPEPSLFPPTSPSELPGDLSPISLNSAPMVSNNAVHTSLGVSTGTGDDTASITSITDAAALGQLSTESIPSDLVTDLLLRFYGEERASGRWTITAMDVPDNVQGVMKLLQNKCFRAAVDFTGQYFATHASAQAPGTPMKHTTETMQILLIRVASLAVLGLWDKAVHTLDLIGDLNREDLNHTQSTNGKEICAVPFSLHLLAAVVPFKAGHEHDALNNLYSLWQYVRKQRVIAEAETHPACNNDATVDWEAREEKVTGALVWALIQLQEFQLALDILSALPPPLAIHGEHEVIRKQAYREFYRSRINITVGDIGAASVCMDKGVQLLKPLLDVPPTEEEAVKAWIILNVDLHINKGNLFMAKGDFMDGLKEYLAAVELAPKDIAASNNLGVAYVYLGRLSDSIALSKTLLAELKAKNDVPPSQIVLNLSTMHELESARSSERKQELIQCVENTITDSYPVQALKL
eukprot:CFRG1372T1